MTKRAQNDVADLTRLFNRLPEGTRRVVADQLAGQVGCDLAPAGPNARARAAYRPKLTREACIEALTRCAGRAASAHEWNTDPHTVEISPALAAEILRHLGAEDEAKKVPGDIPAA